MKKNNLILYAVILIFGLAAPYLFPDYKLQISFLWILIVLAMTWDVQGGQMGYNTFGNILFFNFRIFSINFTCLFFGKKTRKKIKIQIIF